MAQPHIRRLSYALGAEVTGVDLRRPPADEAFAAIHKAWLDHSLLLFPGQELDKEELLAFTARFGPVEHLKDNADPEVAGIRLVTNKPVDGKPWDGYKNGPTWHTDRSYSPQPTAIIFLHAREVPDVGGDTLFANMYLAYETLSPKLQALIEPLGAIHDRGVGQIPAGMTLLQPHLVGRASSVASHRAGAQPPTVHPVVRIHPVTKRRSLYLSERARHFLGMTEEESRPLIDFLNAHSVRYEFTYRHRWTAGDLVLWDNRCMLHKALCDYDLEFDIRHMHRTAVAGEEIGYWYTPEVAESVASR